MNWKNPIPSRQKEINMVNPMAYQQKSEFSPPRASAISEHIAEQPDLPRGSGLFAHLQFLDALVRSSVFWRPCSQLSPSALTNCQLAERV
jgi:hypothetical protein